MQELPATAKAVAEKLNADVILFNGEITRVGARLLSKGCRPHRPNVLLVLVTFGGDAGAAYKAARCLQERYTRFTVLVPGPCKSAGTLLAVGAHAIVIGDDGELGPLDVQMRKPDDLWDMSSGQTVMEAMDFLKEQGLAMLEHYFLELIGRSGGQITLKTSTEIAVSTVTRLLDPIYRQIDPMHLGEAARGMQVARDYGERLSDLSANLKDQTLAMLVNGFSGHSFIIDRREAADYFINVRKPSDEEATLIEQLGDLASTPGLSVSTGDEPFISVLSELPLAADQTHTTSTTTETHDTTEETFVHGPANPSAAGGGTTAEARPAPQGDGAGAGAEVVDISRGAPTGDPSRPAAESGEAR